MNITTFADSDHVSFSVFYAYATRWWCCVALNYDSYLLILNFFLGLNVCRFESPVEEEPIENGL